MHDVVTVLFVAGERRVLDEGPAAFDRIAVRLTSRGVIVSGNPDRFGTVVPDFLFPTG